MNNIVNIFNRILMILFSAISFAAGLIILLLLNGIIQPANVALGRVLALYNLWRAIAALHGASTNPVALAALILLLVGLVVLIFEVAPLVRMLVRHETDRYIVRQDDLGAVTVDREMVRDLVRHEAEAVPGVVKAEPDVSDGSHGLRIQTRAALAIDADAPQVGELVQERIHDTIQNQLGLAVAEVRVATRSAPPAKKPKGRVQ